MFGHGKGGKIKGKMKSCSNRTGLRFIIPRYLQLAIRNDEELYKLFSTVLLPKKTEKKA
ncbi:H2A protein, partial [Acromyrmex charruanus]